MEEPGENPEKDSREKAKGIVAEGTAYLAEANSKKQPG